MLRTHCSLLALLIAGFWMSGCAEETAAPVASGDSAEATEGLSAEDQPLADAQKICPVAGEPLGSMGTPQKVMVEDRPVFICCEGCREELLAHPEKYLAVLDKAAEGGEEAAPTEAPAQEESGSEEAPQESAEASS